MVAEKKAPDFLFHEEGSFDRASALGMFPSKRSMDLRSDIKMFANDPMVRDGTIRQRLASLIDRYKSPPIAVYTGRKPCLSTSRRTVVQ